MTEKANAPTGAVAPTGANHNLSCSHYTSFYRTGQDIFSEVKARVPMLEAAEFYGFHPNRAGYIICPFHNEKTGSLRLYPKNWYCFGCGQGGDAVTFISKLFALDSLGAVRRLNEDFHLGLSLDRPPTAEESVQAQRRQRVTEARRMFFEWRESLLNRLCRAYRTGHLALRDKRPDEWTAQELLAVRWMPLIEYWADTLDYGDFDKQMTVFRARKEVEKLCNKILASGLPMRSLTA